MCTTCGCSKDGMVRLTGMAVLSDDHGHRHDVQPAPVVGQAEQHGCERTPVDEAVPRHRRLEIDILAKNDELAKANRELLRDRRIVTLNLMSSPGSGKTTLLVRTLRELDGEMPVAVVEGDQETQLDAARIQATGAPVVQVNTGAGCHLDADMMRRAINHLDPVPGTLLFVENVGNLVCPAAFDLGELARIVIISVTEGDDKPAKYPQMFACADLLIVNKIDLLPYVDFDVDACVARARAARPGLQVLALSATSGAGAEQWYDWLRRTRTENS